MPTDREATPQKLPADLTLGVRVIIKERDRLGELIGAIDLILGTVQWGEVSADDVLVGLEGLRELYGKQRGQLFSAQAVLEQAEQGEEGPA